MDWFSENFKENKNECYHIIINATIRHSCTQEDIFEACKVLMMVPQEEVRLYDFIKAITKMRDLGINASEAGERLRDLLEGFETYKAKNGKIN